MAAGVPSRTDVQCRERFKNVLDPQLSASPWTEGAHTAASPLRTPSPFQLLPSFWDAGGVQLALGLVAHVNC